MTRAPRLRPLFASCCRTSCALALLSLLSSSALANDVEASIKGNVPVGEQPAFVIKVHKDLRRATLEVRSSKGLHRQSLGPAKKGQSLEFKLPHKNVGKLHWQGKLSADFDDGGSGTMPVGFATEVVAIMTFQVTNDQDDIQKNHRVVVEADGTVSKVDVEVYGEDDALLASQSVPFENAAAGTPLTVDWVPGKEGPVLRVQVTVHDEHGLHRSGQFYPFVISVPHDEVVFDSGKADVLPREEPKLQAALEKIRVVVKRYARGVAVGGGELRIFVSGFTDTVGGSASNRALSERRARAIGEWFKRNGVGVPVYVRGYGEDVLKVETADETDEEKNRRADYDLSVNGPTGSLTGWSRL